MKTLETLQKELASLKQEVKETPTAAFHFISDEINVDEFELSYYKDELYDKIEKVQREIESLTLILV